MTEQRELRETSTGECPRTVAVAFVAAFVAALTGLPGSSATAAEPPSAPRFERDVWPILAVHCTACHGADEPKAGLDLRTAASIERGGESGAALVKSDPAASLLVQKIEAAEMPPPGERRLAADQVALLRAWVQAGGLADRPDVVPPPVSPVSDRDRRFWSFRPLAAVVPPLPTEAIRSTTHIRAPIDAFLMERLSARSLSFSVDATPTTLVRRAYLDLLGLPPSPTEVDAFLADDRPDAFERLIERLLASPHFGQRWGRHWLDVAGYVDTVGFDTDATNIITSEGKWQYRDWVIRAFDDDKPYDRFITEQLAGDELYDWRRAERFTPEIRDALVATGYLRTARDLTHEDVGVIPQNYYGIMHDTLEIVGSGLLGLTLNCARCHSHKFDPIPQEDYYRVMAVLAPAYNPQAWRPVIPYEPKVEDRALADVSPAEQVQINQHNAELDRQAAELRGRLAALRAPHERGLSEAKLSALPEAIRADVKSAVETPADKRSEVQKYLAEKFAAALQVKPEEVAKELSDSERAQSGALESEIKAAESRRIKWGKIQALYDIGPTPTSHLLLRGGEQTPGPEVQAGFLRVLCRTDAGAVAAALPPVAESSGRRTALARWLTEPDTPASALLARVMVNRVWQQLYGRGIVPTSDNFGVQGQPPTHPELLEWLARRFVEGGWRIKPLVKLMMTSTAYRQSSRREPTAAASTAPDPEAVDPANDLLWRMRLRRLESEVVRDSILAVSGQLNPAMGGPPVQISAQPDGMVIVAKDRLSDATEAHRRSVYLVARRAYNLSLLTTFDQPLLATNCLNRDESAVPLQSLVMLNDAFVAQSAEALARRIEDIEQVGSSTETAARDAARIEWTFRLVLGRRPNDDERSTCGELAAQQMSAFRASGAAPEEAAHAALVQLCQVLLNTSEFLYAE